MYVHICIYINKERFHKRGWGMYQDISSKEKDKKARIMS